MPQDPKLVDQYKQVLLCGSSMILRTAKGQPGVALFCERSEGHTGDHEKRMEGTNNDGNAHAVWAHWIGPATTARSNG